MSRRRDDLDNGEHYYRYEKSEFWGTTHGGESTVTRVPVLKPLVRERLEGRLAPSVDRYTVEPGGGAYLVVR